MKYISLLGATGSIGMQSLQVIREHADAFKLVAMSAGRNMDSARKIIREFHPELVCMQTKEDCETLRTEFSSNIRFTYGSEGLIEVAVHDKANVLLNAVSGSVGMLPTLSAIEEKKTIALANKETLVVAGHIIMEAAAKHRVDVLPVDSEHSAIFQCLLGQEEKSINRLLITASGGSFRHLKRDQLQDVTLQQALQHPNWSMGSKITIDSATMMNKGLEVIEAHWLFQMPYEKIDVLLHRQSIIHSLVEFEDTSVIAQLGSPDMRVPIQFALSYPHRLPIPQPNWLDLTKTGNLQFEEMDMDRFRCLKFAYEAGKTGGTMPAVLNAANEIAVSAFLNEKISFLAIEDLIEKALANHKPVMNPDLAAIQIVDRETRDYVSSLI